MFVYGVDIGGTTIKLGRLNDQGELLKQWEIDTRLENDGDGIVPDIAKALNEDMKEEGLTPSDIQGIGIGIPGPILPDGRVNGCINLGWGVRDIPRELSEIMYGLPVVAGNDANVAALGENWKGGGQGAKSMVMVTIGTGVGGGIIIDGNIVTGANGAGGEIGHIHLNDEEEESCACGNKGCLEQYASATGIVKHANQILETDSRDSLLRNEPVTAKAIFDAAKQGDEIAEEVVEWMGELLGVSLSYLAVALDPEVFVIGGGVSKAGNILLEAIQKHYRTHAFHSNKETPFKLATLGNDAGIVGAARLVYEK